MVDARPGPVMSTDIRRIPPETLEALVHWARRLTGIALHDRKEEFLVSRLGLRLDETGSGDFGRYLSILERDPSEATRFAEALTTHTTSFFREKAQYDWLEREGFQALVRSPRVEQTLLVWSAACSTGQEGYSALMSAEQARLSLSAKFRVRLLGTDISRPVLQTARMGIYDRSQIREIPEALRPRFLLSSRKENGVYRMVPALRRQASWRRGNLVTGEGLGSFQADCVFLRNVLIYFDEPQRRAVLDNVLARLRPGGFLFVGHTEGCHARRPELEAIRPAIYRRKASS